MKIIKAGLPDHEYEQIFIQGALPPRSKEILQQAVARHDFRHIVLYGKGQTADAVQEVLGDAVRHVVDTASLGQGALPPGDVVILATAPNHYPAILQNLEALEPDMPAMPLFVDASLPVALVMETQPRSGTHYVIDNVLAATDLAYADIFGGKGLDLSQDGLLFHEPGHQGAFVVKTHFTRPLHYPAYRYVKTAFLFSYFFDSYYSWAKLLLGRKGPDTYRLCADSSEWSVLKGYFDLHLQWLDYIQGRFRLRYEDFYHDFPGTVRALENFSGLELAGFAPPRPNPGRCYWADNYAQRFDKTVCNTLEEVFRPWLEAYYPEKIADIERARTDFG